MALNRPRLILSMSVGYATPLAETVAYATPIVNEITP